jgi:hypothetical protein
MTWLVIVPDPANELTISTFSRWLSFQRRWKSGKTPLLMASPRMLNP